MDYYLVDRSLQHPVLAVLVLSSIAWVAITIQQLVYNLFFHPLTKFPGPNAAAATPLWKFYIEIILGKNLCDHLLEIQPKYGDIIRIGPNELHFSDPQAYQDIYNNKNRWDKEYKFYHSFNEDESSFGYVTYKEAKERRDILNRLFAPKSIELVQGLVVEKINALCAAFDRQASSSKALNLFHGFRCFTMDVITYICFGQSVDAINEPDFKAPIVTAMDASLPVFIGFRHSELYMKMITGCPPSIAKLTTPDIAGLIDMQQMFLRLSRELTTDRSRIRYLPHNMTIFHQLLNPDVHPNKKLPSAKVLFDETQSLMFAGGDTTGNTLMLSTFYLLQDRVAMGHLKEELKAAWPDPDPERAPTLRELEKLPYLNGVIKEGLRMTSGVVSPLPRVVPAGGAKITGVFVPAGSTVSCGATFVHNNPNIFPEPFKFKPERWIDNPDLDTWLVSFSKGPRMCLGINLAWMELRLAFAHIYRRYNITAAQDSPKTMPFRDAFVPFYYGPHLHAHLTPVTS